MYNTRVVLDKEAANCSMSVLDILAFRFCGGVFVRCPTFLPGG